MTEPCFDIAHLAHVEMYTDKFEESLDFFVNVYGLTVSGQDENSAYLRAFDDYEFHSLKLIGVLAAVTVATACTLPESPAAGLAVVPTDGRFRIEHPTGALEVFLEFAADGAVASAGTIRTARKLFDGRVF